MLNLKSLLILVSALCTCIVNAIDFKLPEERTTGLGCIQDGETVSYECTVADPAGGIGSTIWLGDAFNCSPSNQISLLHSQYQSEAKGICGPLMAEAISENGTHYTSRLTFNVSIELDGRMINCTLSSTELIGSDIIKAGVQPPAPRSLSVMFKPPATPLTVFWSQPSVPVVGGVGGYMFTVIGVGCGCVSTNVSANTTSVTCSGWTANNQTCSFEVMTISKDCALISDSATTSICLIVECDPEQLGSDPTSNTGRGSVIVANGNVVYTGVSPQSTASLICDNGFQPAAGEDNLMRQCMNNGNWSGEPQSCTVSETLQSLGWIAVIGVALVLLIATVVIVGYCCYRKFHPKKNAQDLQFQDVTSNGDQIADISSKKKSAPDGISRPIDPVTHGNVAYFRPFQAEGRTVFIWKCELPDTQTSSELNTRAKSPIYWSCLKKCPEVNDTSLVFINTNLYTVGGDIDGKRYTNKISYFDESSQCWKSAKFPPMSIRRKQATVILHGTHLIVAGGREETGSTNAVEILDLAAEEKKWKKAAYLPCNMFRASGCICNGYLYLLGGFDIERGGLRTPINASYEVLLSDLIASCGEKPSVQPVFKKIADPPLYNSAFACVSGRIFAIGGTEEDGGASSSGSIYEYKSSDDTWSERGEKLNQTRSHPFAVTFESRPNEVMVVGGNAPKQDSRAIGTFEFIKLL